MNIKYLLNSRGVWFPWNDFSYHSSLIFYSRNRSVVLFHLANLKALVNETSWRDIRITVFLKSMVVIDILDWQNITLVAKDVCASARSRFNAYEQNFATFGFHWTGMCSRFLASRCSDSHFENLHGKYDTRLPFINSLASGGI